MDVVCMTFDGDKCVTRLQDIGRCSVDGLPNGRGLIASVVSLRGFTHGKLHDTVARCKIEMVIWR